MARPIYAINLTASGVSINDLSGLYIDPFDTVDLRLFFSLDQIDYSEDLATAISNGLIVLNDGERNLTLEESEEISSLPTLFDIPSNFLDLDDTPSTFSGSETKYAKVNSTASGIEFSTIGHNELTGLTNDDHPQYVPTDGSRGFSSTVSGVDPINDGDLATKKYVDDTVASGSFKYLQWAQSPTYNGVMYLLGWYIQTDTNVFIDNDPLISASEAGYSAHFVLNVSSVSGTLPMTTVVSGTAVYENSGETFVAVENLTVTGTGYYQTAASFITTPSFYVEDSGDGVVCDIYRTSYWDCGNRNFTLRGCRMEFTPDSTTWNIQLKLYRIVDDGSTVTLDDKTFASTDEFPRAGHSLVGKYKRTDYNYFMHGDNNEGLIVEVDQFGINYFNLLLQYND